MFKPTSIKMKLAISFVIGFTIYGAIDGGIESAIAGLVCSSLAVYWLRDLLCS